MFHQPPPPVNEGFGAIEGLGLNIVSSDRKLESDFRDFAKDPVLITRSEQVSSNLLNLFCLKYFIIISTSFEFDFVQRIVIFLSLFWYQSLSLVDCQFTRCSYSLFYYQPCLWLLFVNGLE